MQRFREHILSKIIVVSVAVTLLAPATVKIFHFFAEHDHLVCTSNSTHHYHESSTDCEFYKFKVSKVYAYLITNDTSLLVTFEPALISSKFDFRRSHQDLSFALRGPPVLV